MDRMLTRFFKAIAIDTKADDSVGTVPSSPGQFVLAEYLATELRNMGASDVFVDEHAYVYAKVPATINDPQIPAVGFLAHLDTAQDLGGCCTNPQAVDYKGGIIPLGDSGYVLDPKDFPVLNKLVGQTLITTDGTTLLGADDKAGLVSCLEIMQYYLENPELPHGTICFAACPDEEIGHGASLLDLDRFGADFAYTIDGGDLGELEYENFNAAYAILHINGRSVHPGSAKNTMINSIDVAFEFDALLPKAQRPQHTEGYEGFYMPNNISGGVDSTELRYLVRDHSAELFEAKKAFLRSAADFINRKYGREVIRLELKDSYRNMREIIEKTPEVFDLAKNAMLAVGVPPLVKPVRGGTDGAQLSYRGLPCPNFFTGGYNFHGRFEFIAVESMRQAVNVGIEIIKQASELKSAGKYGRMA